MKSLNLGLQWVNGPQKGLTKDNAGLKSEK